MEPQTTTGKLSTMTVNIQGLHCGSCVQRVEAALSHLPGVRDAKVSLSDQKADINYEVALLNMDDLKAAVEAEGYRIFESGAKEGQPRPPYSGRVSSRFSEPWPYIFGGIASFAIVGIYFAMNTLTADWYWALIQFKEYRWWIVALAFGLGVQVTLFSKLRAQLRKNRMRAAKSSMAASGGVSVAAMMACCSHYLAAVLPALSLPFLSAAAVAQLEQYQSYFFLAGILSCGLGIGLMARIMKKNGMIPTDTIWNAFVLGFSRLMNTGGTRNDNVEVL